MSRKSSLTAISIFLLATIGLSADATLYRIELKGKQVLWSQDRPQPNRAFLLFHRYPGGVLMSVRRSEVVQVVESDMTAPAARTLAPGAEVFIGPTGGGGSSEGRGSPASGAASSLRRGPLAPGEAPGGTALFNPDRPYRPDWDAKQVPGLNLGYPNSPNDYREGRTLARPSASAVQSAPGAPPSMPPGNGEPPPPPKPQ